MERLARKVSIYFLMSLGRGSIFNRFSKGVVDYLAEKCGGMLRDFIRLLGYTIELGQAGGEGTPIPQRLAERAFRRRLVNEYGRMVPDEHFDLLARVAKNKQVRNDTQHQAMLYNLSVLEYMNGDRWCDVHPAVRELAEFKNAWSKLGKPANDAESSG
jgi:hypothetical protein